MSDEVQSFLIADIARRLFVERGYGATTMSSVASCCHVSKRTLYRLFPGKSGLLAAIIDRHRYGMLALPGNYDDVPMETALAEIFRVDITPADDIERRAVVRLTIVETAYYSEVGALMRSRGVDRSRVLPGEWLNRRARMGDTRLEDPQEATGMLMDMIFGAQIAKGGSEPDRPGNAGRACYIRRCIRIFLKGIVPR